MNDIVLNGETLEISRVIDSIEIEGFDHTFADGKAESKLVIHTEAVDPVLESLSVTENGTYTPEEGVDGFNEVSVNVESESGVIPFNCTIYPTKNRDTHIAEGRYVRDFISYSPYVPLTSNRSWPEYDTSKSFKIHVKWKIKSPALSKDAQAIIGSVYGYYEQGVSVEVNRSGIWAGYTTSAVTWTSQINITHPSDGILYAGWNYIDYEWNGTVWTVTATYSDGSVQTYSVNVSNARYTGRTSDRYGICLGGNNLDDRINAADLIIDLSDCYHEEDNVIIWGCKGFSPEPYSVPFITNNVNMYTEIVSAEVV